MSKNQPIMWVVLEDEQDESFSVLNNTDIVCDTETVKISDEVMYFWNKQERKGKIRFVSEDHSMCSKEASRLNSQRKKEAKKEDSFHIDRPRRAAVKFMSTLKCKQSGDEPPKKKIKKKSQEARKKETKEKSNFILMKRLVEASNSEALQSTSDSRPPGSSCTNSAKMDVGKQRQTIYSDSSESEDLNPDERSKGEEVLEQAPPTILDKRFPKKSSPTNPKVKQGLQNQTSYFDSSGNEEKDCDKSHKVSEEDLKQENESSSNASVDSASDDDTEPAADLVQKLAAQLAKKFDVKALLKLTKTSTQGVMEKSVASSLFEKGMNATHNSCTQDETAVTEKSSLNNPPGNSLLDTNTLSEGDHEDLTMNKEKKNNFVGTMFLVAEPRNGIEVKEGSGIYCNPRKFKDAEDCGSAGAAVRNLLVGVFSREALQACSLTGLPPRGKGRNAYKTDPSLIRPSLDQEAVNTIIDQVILWQQIKHWRPKRDRHYLRCQMSVKLCELRAP